MRGTLIAGVGGGLFLGGGLYLTPETLSVWGLPLFVVAMGLMAFGLIPYRRLCRLEVNPYEAVPSDEGITFYAQKKKRFTIPRASIERMAFCEKGRAYGIGVWLKQPLPEKVVVHEKGPVLHSYRKWARKRFGCDLFLPYFTKRGLAQLE